MAVGHAFDFVDTGTELYSFSVGARVTENTDHIPIHTDFLLPGARQDNTCVQRVRPIDQSATHILEVVQHFGGACDILGG